MSDRLKGLFGSGGGDANEGGDTPKVDAQDFVKRYMDGDPTEGYSKDEALSAFQSVAQRASPEQMEQAARQAVGNMRPNQRAEFAEMLRQRQAGQGFVPIERAGEGGRPPAGGGGGGGLDDILGGFMGGGGGGGLGGILGGLLGGGGQGGQTSGRGGGSGLDDMLGGVLGGDDDSPRTQQRGGQESGGMLGGVGDLLGSPVGKALVGGIAAFAMKEMMEKK